jgi:hypothetical protein
MQMPQRSRDTQHNKARPGNTNVHSVSKYLSLHTAGCLPLDTSSGLQAVRRGVDSEHLNVSFFLEPTPCKLVDADVSKEPAVSFLPNLEDGDRRLPRNVCSYHTTRYHIPKAYLLSYFV